METYQSGPQEQPGQQHHPYGGHYPVPNSTEVLVLGILSIVFCWCYGLISVILAVICLVMASEGEKQYRLNPPIYSLSSYKNLRTGRTCAIIGLCLAGLAIIAIIAYILLFGTLAYNMFKLGME